MKAFIVVPQIGSRLKHSFDIETDTESLNNSLFTKSKGCHHWRSSYISTLNVKIAVKWKMSFLKRFCLFISSCCIQHEQLWLKGQCTTLTRNSVQFVFDPLYPSPLEVQSSQASLHLTLLEKHLMSTNKYKSEMALNLVPNFMNVLINCKTLRNNHDFECNALDFVQMLEIGSSVIPDNFYWFFFLTQSKYYISCRPDLIKWVVEIDCN